MASLDVSIVCAHCCSVCSGASYSVSSDMAQLMHDDKECFPFICRECVQSGFTLQSILLQLQQVQQENRSLKSNMQEDARITAGLDAQETVLCDDSMYQVLQCIIGYLPAEDVCRVSKVCRHWGKVANSALIWKFFCQQEDVPLEGGDAQSEGYYKSLYADYTVVRRKWLTGQRVTTKQTALIHPNGEEFGEDCLAISTQHLFLPHNRGDPGVYVICAATGQYMHQLVGHTTLVFRLVLSSNELIAVTSPYSGNDVCVWDVTTGQCLHTLIHPADDIGRMWICGELLVCSIRANGVRSMFMWNIETGEKLFEHQEGVYFCARDGSHMAISVDGFIRLLDVNTWVTLLSVPCNMRYVQEMLLNCDQHSLVALNESNLTLWDTNSGFVKATYNVRLYSSMTAHAGKLYLAQPGPDRQTVTVYDMASGAILNTIQGSEFEGWCRALPVLSNGVLVVEGDEWLSIWDTKRQVHARDIGPYGRNIRHPGWRFQQCNASVNRLQYVDDIVGLTYFTHNFDP